jgi:hypothetical protein
MIRGPVGPATGRLEWLDAEGKVVGPAKPSRNNGPE